ncbi:unnamed protein product [Rotaria socialis]|uniref:G domain-containing protein n=1 Tax=Rotaria socialis TaxID=392032 RepID=A0A817UPV1_9BILA|nr:unnamed protein product [Rotaria socialis]CAF3332861.1 unnamed protein product [Rotaria socialis]CAF3385964.1 unnamed protein product [Rotaria socialis]CAF3428716.1 unnamed protein product [Rotaria socialis]CAF4549739.1 unnamed protein product [Rotaria socialis]
MNGDQEQTTDQSHITFIHDTFQNIRGTLSQDYFDREIESVLDRFAFNIVIMGSPRVGKSELINALCGGSPVAQTSSSLDSCTQEFKKYVLTYPQPQLKGFPSIEINIFDTPGVESWDDKKGEQEFLKFIDKSVPICVIYCASPGCFSPLGPLRFLLEHCREKHIICALICTNMWSNNNRNTVIEEFKKELEIFGIKTEKNFEQDHPGRPHKVTFFGNNALCAMVNSIEYVDQEMDVSKPVQGVDELIASIMGLLDSTKMIAWCITVLNRRSFWEKISHQTNGFLELRFMELQNMKEKSASEIAHYILHTAIKTYLNLR